MKILPQSERAEIRGGYPNCKKIPTVKILPRSESAEISGGNPNHEKIPTVKILPRSESAEIGGGNPNHEKIPTVKNSPDLRAPRSVEEIPTVKKKSQLCLKKRFTPGAVTAKKIYEAGHELVQGLGISPVYKKSQV